jgi:predicted Zn-dependent protease
MAPALFACSTDGGQFISEEEEIAVGLEVDRQIREQFLVCTADLCDPELLSWVQETGDQVAAVSSRPDLNYTFTVLHSDIVNAFAAPGGFIYITTGLVRQASSTSEVVGVLAHEVGHVVERHGAEQMEQELGLQILEELIFDDDGSAASEVASWIVGGYTGFVQSKDKELEADVQGVILSARANYSPAGIVNFFKTLQSLFGSSDPVSEILSSHPSPADRIANAEKVIASENLDVSSFPLDGDVPYAQLLSWLPPPANDQ